MGHKQHAIMGFLSTGGWKSTRLIHKYLRDEGFKISRSYLLKILNKNAECGGIEVIGGTRQKVWGYPT